MNKTNGIILSDATYPGAPSYGGVRTWVEGSQARGNRALAEASNLLGWKEYNCLTQAVVNHYTDYIPITQEDYQLITPNIHALLIHQPTVGRDNMYYNGKYSTSGSYDLTFLIIWCNNILTITSRQCFFRFQKLVAFV